MSIIVQEGDKGFRATSWFEAVVIEVRKNQRDTGNIGSFRFQSCPRVGEEVSLNDDQGVGQVYKVISVVHAPAREEAVPTVVGDLFVVWIGTHTDWHTRTISEGCAQAIR